MPEPLATEYEDTIAAISTPPGEGGVGIVRLSGSEAFAIAANIFVSSRNKDILTGNQRVYHGHIVNEDGARVDEVLLHRMRAPRTYTCENVVEINGHGGQGPLNAILEQALRCGARLARPGEFTQRAFLNGRIDLVQAEAVIDQIRARTRTSLQAANAAAGGALSRALERIRERLRQALSRMEAAVDFPEEDLPELIDRPVIESLEATRREMAALLETADAGRLYREGATVAIVGRPNVGKSSCFNALLRDARAIVTAVPGTTRDRLEEYITLGGVPVRLIDTAGLRVTADEVEQIGVERARQALREANLVVFLLDAAAPPTDEDRALAEEVRAVETPAVLALNKIDLAPEAAPPEGNWSFHRTCRISALTGEGLQALEDTLGEMLLGGVNVAAGEPMLNRLHQKTSLRRAHDCVDRLLGDPSASPELLALELQEALQAVGEITGETTPDDILDTIFSDFCIGK